MTHKPNKNKKNALHFVFSQVKAARVSWFVDNLPNTELQLRKNSSVAFVLHAKQQVELY